MKRVVLFSLCLCVCAGMAFAQGATTGAISGVVADPNGDALPGATVQAVLQTTATRYATVTDGMGRFNILNMRVGGPYLVTVSLDGFQDNQKGDVYVTLGESNKLTVQLQLEAVTAELVVVSESNPLISPSRTGAASNVGLEAIERLPTIERGFADFARTNPLISVIPSGDEGSTISVAGRNNRYNNIQIDGAVNNDLFGLASSGTPGGQTETQPISLDAIQEFQLVIAPFDVRQGGFSGGGVNAITRSGTNTLHGSVYGFTRDEGFVGNGPADFPELGTFEENQYGFRVGGPIKRDKSFFFVSGEISTRDRPSGWSMDGSTGQWFANGDVIPEAERFRSILMNQYGYDPGGLSEVTRYTDSDKLLVKADFNLADSHNLTLRHNFIDAANLIHRGDDDEFQFPNNAYDMQDETNSTVAQLDSVFGDNKFNQLRVTYQTIVDRRHGVGEDFPNVTVYDVEGYEFTAGTEPYSTHNAMDQDIIEITNDFTFFIGDHEITVGTHNELFGFDNIYLNDGYGTYLFETLDDLEAGLASEYEYTYSNDDQPSDKWDVQQLGFYAGDQWRVKSNLTLILGLRADIPLLPDTPNYNPLVEEVFGYRTDQIPDGNVMWSPRLGFNYDIDGDGQQQLRGGIGLFSGRPPYVFISNAYGRTGIEQTSIFVDTGEYIPFDPDPYSQPVTVPGVEVVGSYDINLVADDFKYPQVWRYNLAYDRQLPWWNLVGTAEVVFTQSENEVNFKNLNIVQTGETAFDGRPLYERYNDEYYGAFLLYNSGAGEQTNAIVKLERPYGHGAWGFLSYTWGDSKVINDATSSRAQSNWQYNEAPDPNNPGTSTSDFEVEHRFTAMVSYEFNRDSKWATTISAFYNHQSGRPYTAIFRTMWGIDSFNNDRFYSNDPLYIPADASEVIIEYGTWEQFDAWLSSAGLDGYKGQIAPRNVSVAPWTHQLDLHLGQDVPVGYGNLELTLDIFNFMNMLDSDSGHVRFVPYGTVQPIEYRGTDDDTGLPIYRLRYIVSDPENNSMFNLDNLRSRWQAKLGVRWSF